MIALRVWSDFWKFCILTIPKFVVSPGENSILLKGKINLLFNIFYSLFLFVRENSRVKQRKNYMVFQCVILETLNWHVIELTTKLWKSYTFNNKDTKTMPKTSIDVTVVSLLSILNIPFSSFHCSCSVAWRFFLCSCSWFKQIFSTVFTNTIHTKT